MLTWSILLYAFSSVASGFSTSVWMLFVFRCTTFIGVCVEFVAAVAWVAELFADPKQREAVLGFTQAFASVGGLLVTSAYALSNRLAGELPSWASIYGEQTAWRYALISGIIPALPLIIIRPFLPESPSWRAKKVEGKLKRPSIARIVPRIVPPDDDRHDGPVCLRVRRGVRRNSTDAPDRSRVGP